MRLCLTVIAPRRDALVVAGLSAIAGKVGRPFAWPVAASRDTTWQFAHHRDAKARPCSTSWENAAPGNTTISTASFFIIGPAEANVGLRPASTGRRLTDTGLGRRRPPVADGGDREAEAERQKGRAYKNEIVEFVGRHRILLDIVEGCLR